MISRLLKSNVGLFASWFPIARWQRGLVWTSRQTSLTEPVADIFIGNVNGSVTTIRES